MKQLSNLSLEDRDFFQSCSNIIRRQAADCCIPKHCLLQHEEMVAEGFYKLATYFPTFQKKHPHAMVDAFFKGFKVACRNQMLNKIRYHLGRTKRGGYILSLSEEVERLQVTALPLAEFMERDAVHELRSRLSIPAQEILEQMLEPHDTVIALAVSDSLRRTHVKGFPKVSVRPDHIARFLGVSNETVQMYITEIRRTAMELFPEYGSQYAPRYQTNLR